MKKIFLTAILLSSILLNSFSQDLKVGALFGLGNSKYILLDDSEEMHSDKISKLGFSLGYSPFLSNFTIVSGIEYEDRGVGSYLTVPLGLKISVGQTFRVFADGGAYYSYIAKEKTETFILERDWGFRAGGGIAWAITKRIKVDLAYQYSYGMAESLKKETLIPGGLTNITSSTYRASLFYLAIIYRF